MVEGESGLFGHIWSRFLGLKGAPMAPNLYYCPPQQQQGKRTWYRHFLGDFRLGWPLYMMFERGQRQIGLIWTYLGSLWGQRGTPIVPNVWYDPPQHRQDRQTWYRHSLGDFRLGWPLITLKTAGKHLHPLPQRGGGAALDQIDQSGLKFCRAAQNHNWWCLAVLN